MPLKYMYMLFHTIFTTTSKVSHIIKIALHANNIFTKADQLEQITSLELSQAILQQ